MSRYLTPVNIKNVERLHLATVEGHEKTPHELLTPLNDETRYDWKFIETPSNKFMTNNKKHSKQKVYTNKQKNNEKERNFAEIPLVCK